MTETRCHHAHNIYTLQLNGEVALAQGISFVIEEAYIFILK